jgi:hypothetical protein
VNDCEYQVWLSTLHDLLTEYRAKYKHVGTGRHREVFQISPTHVVKVPTCDWGMDSNYMEESRFKRCGRNGYIPYATCSLEHDRDIPLLTMEYVEHHHEPWAELPEWTLSVDCGQVGHSAIDGKLVAYDYGE